MVEQLSGRRRNVDAIDGELASFRQRLAIEMADRGIVTPEEAGDIMADTLRPAIVSQERRCFTTGRFSPDSPGVRLATHLAKSVTP